MVVLKKVLVTTDLSDHSLAAMEFASTLGLFYGARLYLLHVEDIAPPEMYSAHVHDFYGREYRDRAAGESQQELVDFTETKVRPMLGSSAVRLDPVLRLGEPVAEVLKFVEEEGIDLIVIATHGRTGFRHVLMGSVAEKLVRMSPVPVLTVKPLSMGPPVLKPEDIESDLHLR
jgi:nucleotide-binding universal stress UspA family protein